jgi:hypothetical protein
MAEPQYDLAVFGSTPLAGLLSGLLARQHGRRACLVREPSSPFRLARGVDLSAMPATRPETWALLKAGTAETLHLLAQLGARRAVRRIDAAFIGETAPTIDALSHIRYLAWGFGIEAEWFAPPSGGSGLRVRDAVLLDRTGLEGPIEAWLEATGVVRFEPRATEASLHRDGSVRLVADGRTIEAAQGVFVDDAAIIDRLDPTALASAAASVRPATSVLTASARRLAAPFEAHIDRGVVLLRDREGGILGLGAGRAEQALPQIGACLGERPLRRSGQHGFANLATADGAPLIGRIGGRGPTVVAGLGLGAAFMAPALARFLAGAADDREAGYFAARAPGPRRALAVDFVGGAPAEAAA